jgi:hypothetical protein
MRPNEPERGLACHVCGCEMLEKDGSQGRIGDGLEGLSGRIG